MLIQTNSCWYLALPRLPTTHLKLGSQYPLIVTKYKEPETKIVKKLETSRACLQFLVFAQQVAQCLETPGTTSACPRLFC